jgi:fructose-bisphosphate aldolase class II/tagatose 1,6-diphosphate aldolase GatY/KbaY
MLQEAIRNGISKVNLATETKNAFMLALKHTLSESEDIDLRNVFPLATKAIIELISNKLEIISKA